MKSNFKSGDLVHVVATIDHTAPLTILIQSLAGMQHRPAVSPEQVVYHEPGPLQAGDKLSKTKTPKAGGGSTPGGEAIVLDGTAIHRSGSKVWVDWSDGTSTFERAAKLGRI